MTTLRPASCPAEVLDWIAWYAEPELPNHVRGSIDRHAAECLACREELSWVREEAEFVARDAPEANRVFDRVLARVRKDVDTPVRTPRRPRAQQRNLLAAAAAILVLVGGAWLGLLAAAPEPLYTASAPAIRVEAQPAFEVIFRDEASWAEIREALGRLNLNIAATPANGSGRIRLSQASDTDPVVSGTDPDVSSTDPAVILEGLRASGLTRFAERALP